MLNVKRNAENEWLWKADILDRMGKGIKCKSTLPSNAASGDKKIVSVVPVAHKLCERRKKENQNKNDSKNRTEIF